MEVGMIDITALINSDTTSAAAQSRSSSQGNELGKDAFLQLMAAQMSTQNPLEPMDNTQFVAQLAQFSSLEQMQNIAKGMDTLALTQTAATNSQMVNLIGKRVITPGSTISLDGSNPISIRFNLEELPKEPIELTVTNDQGVVVRKVAMDQLKVGLNNFLFDGKAENSDTLPAGNYSYSLKTRSNTSPAKLTTFSCFLIDAVAFSGSDIVLKSGNHSVNLSDISEVLDK
jgi:flagellar basal-body rod modification protein FlgD